MTGNAIYFITKIMSFFTNPTDGYHIIFEILKTINTLPCMYRVLTLYNDILRIARNLLETRKTSKLSGKNVWGDRPFYLVKQPQEKWACDFHDDAPPLSFQLQVAEVIF